MESWSTPLAAIRTLPVLQSIAPLLETPGTERSTCSMMLSKWKSLLAGYAQANASKNRTLHAYPSPRDLLFPGIRLHNRRTHQLRRRKVGSVLKTRHPSRPRERPNPPMDSPTSAPQKCSNNPPSNPCPMDSFSVPWLPSSYSPSTRSFRTVN
jgi:hypothetical protein